MLKENVQDALSDQLNAEMYSSYLYLSMSSYFSSTGLAGFANWMRVQAKEELMHAMKFYDYINERGGRIVLKPVEGPPTEWKSPLDAFEHTFRHEQMVTELINGLVDLAIAEKDHATNNFLQWFVSEQVEEEASAGDALQKVKRVGENTSSLFMLDSELAQRIFTPPAQTEGK
jgi:ferritin